MLKPFYHIYSLALFISRLIGLLRHGVLYNFRYWLFALLLFNTQSAIGYAKDGFSSGQQVEHKLDLLKRHKIYIKPQNAASALNLLAEQTDAVLLFNYAQVKTKRTTGIVGRYTLMEALELLLDDSGLVANLTENGILKISAIPLDEVKTPINKVERVDKPSLVSVQDNQENSIEMITITGIRQSLIKSINNKRLSKYIVDSISAEDVGKFPDANIAESLQRITGVSIDRSGGEGRFITIRGLGPEFNSVLFNGRALATDTQGRAFSLDTLASETISMVDVYKSGQAVLSEDSIGGLVNIKTAKPFDHQGFHLSSTVEFLHKESSDKTEPQFSFLVSNSFLDDKLGILASFNHQQRTQVNKTVVNFQNVVGDMTLNKGPLAHFDNDELRVIENVTRPQALGRNVMTEDRERNGGTVVMQYQANDNLLFTLDGLYSEFDVKSSGYIGNTWFWYPTGAYNDALGGKDPILDSFEQRNVVFLQHGATSISSAYREQHRPSNLASMGLNVYWQLLENVNVTSDVFWSNARNRNRGYNKQYVVESNAKGYVEYDYRSQGEYPLLHQGLNTLPSENNIDKVFPAHVEVRGNYIDAENIGAKFDVSWHVDDDYFDKVNFGLHYSSHKKNNIDYSENETSGRLYKNYARDPAVNLKIPKSFLELKSINGLWQGLSDLVYGFQSLDDYLSWLEQPSTLEQLNAHPEMHDAVSLFNNSGGFSAQQTDDSYQVEENITALYASTNLTFDINNMPLDLLMGVRYTHTDILSMGTIQQLNDLVLEISNPNSPRLDKVFASNGEVIHVEKNNQYHHVIPSLIANLNISESLLFRVGLSKTLSRPTLDDIAPWFNYGNTHEIQGNFAQASNPDLTPYLATNTDLSLEWYYAKTGMLSVAVFYKDIDDWVVRTTELMQQPLATSTFDTFNVDRPENGEQVNIRGIELNWIHNFDNGFGFQANATFVDSNADFSKDSLFALEGLSDSSNLMLFYQKNGKQIRLAYNWRDEFLQHTLWNWTNEPVFVASYQQFDLSASWQLNDYSSMFFEAINLTNEKTSKYGRSQAQFLEFSETGSRYAAGIRIKF